MKIGIVTFPGSNCDHDCYKAVAETMEAEPVFLWHAEHDLQGVDAVFLPGGFSYGDYLRAGAIARFSPLMREVQDFAAVGGPVGGICNGFQILCEAGLLPGALIRNRTLSFVSRPVVLEVGTTDSAFTNAYERGAHVTIPVAHGEGCYVADDRALDELEAEDRIAFRYAQGANPNGSARDIAGIVNAGRNVLGLMPHPERAVEELLGSEDGRPLFASLAAHLAAV